LIIVIAPFKNQSLSKDQASERLFIKNMDFAKKEMPLQKPETERNNNSRIFLLA
jgi:hypothetical protein